jgi:hypothetical protein
MKILKITALWVALTCLYIQCGSNQEPFTAEMRFQVDSISGTRIRELRTEIDSQCAQNQRQLMPILADSIYRVRKAQMEAKLREFRSNGK